MVSLYVVVYVPLKIPLGRVADVSRGGVPKGCEVMHVLIAVIPKKHRVRAGRLRRVQVLVVLLVDGVAAGAATERRVADAVRL